jgi:hypothetical protein
VKFCNLATKNNPIITTTNTSEKNGAMSSHFEDFFFEVAIFGQYGVHVARI